MRSAGTEEDLKLAFGIQVASGSVAYASLAAGVGCVALSFRF